MNKVRLRFLIRKLLNSQHVSEDELNLYIDELLKLSPDPNVIDYIFWDELTEEEIFDKVIHYKPIYL